MPHGTTSTVDQSEKWIHDARKQIFPNKVDWAVHAINGAHIWIETDASGCFVSQDCKVWRTVTLVIIIVHFVFFLPLTVIYFYS